MKSKFQIRLLLVRTFSKINRPSLKIKIKHRGHHYQRDYVLKFLFASISDFLEVTDKDFVNFQILPKVPL